MSKSINKPSIVSRATAFAGRAVFSLSATGAWTASAGFNALTGAAMGHDQTTTALWITAAVSLDLLKAGSAVKATTSGTPWGKRIIAVSLLTVATSVSLVAALTMRANSTADAEAIRQAAIEKRMDTKALIKSSSAALQSLPVSRLPAVIDRDMDRLKAKRPWSTSSGCQDATVPASKALCLEYSDLVIERSASIKRAELVKVIADARHFIDTLPIPKAEASPVAAAMVTYLAAVDVKATAPQVQDWLIIFLTLAIEFGAVAGPMLAGNDSKPEVVKQNRVLNRREDMSQAQPLVAANDSKADISNQLLNHLKIEGGSVVTSQRAIAAHLNVSQSTVARAVKDLTNRGLIVSQRPQKGRGTQLVAVG